MGNVNLPTPVVVAGGALCLLGGYLLGIVAGPETPDRTTGVVRSYDASTRELCLTGDTVTEQEGAGTDGSLCGRWQRSPGATIPSEGDEFRFVSVLPADDPEGVSSGGALIYGDVVD